MLHARAAIFLWASTVFSVGAHAAEHSDQPTGARFEVLPNRRPAGPPVLRDEAGAGRTTKRLMRLLGRLQMVPFIGMCRPPSGYYACVSIKFTSNVTQ